MSEPTHKYRAGSALDDESQEEYGHGKMPLIQKAEKVPTAPGSKSIPKKKQVKKGDKKPKKSSPGSSIISLGPLTSASPYNKSITQMYKNLEALRRNTTSSSVSKINNHSISLSNNNNSDAKEDDAFLPYLAPATAPKPPAKMNLDLKTNMSHFMNAATSLAEPSVEASHGFVVASGMVGEEPRMVSYQIREILGVCFSVDFKVEATEQTWMVFVPTTEVLAELLRLIRLRRKIDDMRTLCSWILTCIVLDFDDMRIVSARFDAKQLQDVVTSTLTKMVHHYAIKMQSLIRRFLSNVRLAKVWATKKQIKKSQQEAMKRARERLAQFQAMHQSMAIGNLNNHTGPASPGSRGSRLFPASMNGNRMARHRQSELVSFSPYQQMRSHGDNNPASLKLSPNKRGMAAIPEQRHNVSGSTNTASSSGRKASRSDAPTPGHAAPTTNSLINMRRPSNALGLHMNGVAGNGVGPTSNYASAISEYGGGKTEQQLRLLRRELTGQMTFFEDELMQIKNELEEQKLTLFYSRGTEYKAALKYNPNDDDELGQSGDSLQGSRQNRIHAFKDAPNGTYERDSSGNNGGANNNNNNNNSNNVVQISPAELEQLKTKFSQLESELKEQKQHVEEVARRENEDFSTLQQQQDLKVKEAADRVAKEQMALLEEELQQKEAQISELEKKLAHVMVEQVKAQSNVMKRQEALIEKERTELLEKQELMKKELAELVQQLHTKQVEQQQTMAQAQEKWTQQQQQQQQSLQLQISKQKELIAQMTTQLNEVAMRPAPPVGGRSGRNQGGNNNNSVRKGRFLKSSSQNNNNNSNNNNNADAGSNNPGSSTGNLHGNNEDSIENVPPAGMWNWLSRNLGIGRSNSTSAGNKNTNSNRRATSVPSSNKAGSSGPAGSFSSPVDGTTTPVESAVNPGGGAAPLIRRQSFLGETRRSMQMLTGSVLGSFSGAATNNDDPNNNNINGGNNISDSPVAHGEDDMMGGFLKFLKPLEDLTRVKEEEHEHEDEGISEGGRGHSAGRSAEEEELERQKQLEEELRQDAAEKIQQHFRGYAQRIGLSRWPNYYLEYQQALNPHMSIPGANRYNNNKFVKVDVNTPAVEGNKLLPDKKDAFFKARNEVHIPYSLRKAVFQQGQSTSNPAIINRALYFAVRGVQALEKSLSEGNAHAADAHDKRYMGLTKQDIDMMNRLMLMSPLENDGTASSKLNPDNVFANVSGEELAGLSNLRTLTLFIESILQAAENFVVELNNPLEEIHIHRIFHLISTASYLAEILWLEEQDLQGVLPTSTPAALESNNNNNSGVHVPEPTIPSKSNTSNIVSVVVTAATAGKNVHYTTSAFAKPRLLRERSKLPAHPPTIADQLTLLRRQQRKKIPGYNPTEENQDPEEDIMVYFPSTASPNTPLDRKASASFKTDLPEIFRLKRIVIRGLYFLHQVVKSQPKFWDHCGLSKTGFKAYKKEILAWQQHLQSAATGETPASPGRNASAASSEVTISSGVGGPFMQEVYTFFLSLSRAISGSVRYWSMFAEVQICGHAFRSLYLILCCSIPSLYRPMFVNEELILGLRRCLEHFQIKGVSPGLIASTSSSGHDGGLSGHNTAVSPATSVSGENHQQQHNKYKMDIAHQSGQVHFVLQKSDALEYILKAMVNLCINNRTAQDLLGRFQVPACLLMSLLNLHEDHNPQSRLRNTSLMVLHCRGLINLCAMDHRVNQSMLGKGMFPTIYVKMLLIHAAKIYAIENSLHNNNNNNNNNNKSSLLPITENETDRTEYTLVEQLLRAIVAMALNHEENKLKLQNAGICEVILDLLQALTTTTTTTTTTHRRHGETHTPTDAASLHFYREARQSLVTSLLWALTHLTMASSAYVTIHQRVLRALSALQQSLSVTSDQQAGDQAIMAQEVQKAFQRLNEFTPSSPVQTASPLSSSALRRHRQVKPPSTAIPATSTPKTPFTTKI